MTRIQGDGSYLHKSDDLYTLAVIEISRGLPLDMWVCMAGGPVDWISKLQPFVTASLMEAEYVACFFAVQVVVWILSAA